MSFIRIKRLDGKIVDINTDSIIYVDYDFVITNHKTKGILKTTCIAVKGAVQVMPHEETSYVLCHPNCKEALSNYFANITSRCDS